MRRPRSSDHAVSELQGSLILLAVILIAALALKSAIGDNIVSAALDFGEFKVWGARNEVSYPEGVPVVAIDEPADGSRFYVDHDTAISGSVRSAPGRKAVSVYFRLNGGPWKKAELENGSWRSSSRRYAEGSYHVEAVAYDDSGLESRPASCTFETIFRPYPDARLLGDDVPDVMTSGDLYTVHINYSNSGYLPWNGAGGFELSPNESTMPLSPVGMAGGQVEPHEDRSFKVSIVAPAAGSYVMGYRMRCTDFGWFGDEFVKPVEVVEPFHDASVVSMSMPQEMTVGASRRVSVIMRNTGTAAWSAEGPGTVYLAMVDGVLGDAYHLNGSSDRILLAPSSVVRNGGDYTFNFRIKAQHVGSYYTQYRMAWSGHYEFGQIAGCTILVKANPTPSPTPAPTNGPPGPGKPTPTPTPAPTQYNAHGKMTLIKKDGEEYKGSIRYFYNGPLGNHFERSSRGASNDNDPTWDWDIGGPNGHYVIYNDVDGYSGGLQFDMNNGGKKGKVIFRQ